MSEFSGKTLGLLQVEELLGQGPMSSVYKAHDPARERLVALKVWQDFDKGPTFWDYFPHEMQVITRLSHSHLLPIYDFGEQDGRVWIVMEYVPGGTLLQRLSSGSPLQVREAVTLLTQACDALGYVHQQGRLHRNLKPQNLLLRSEQEVLLSDCGIPELLEYRGRMLIKRTQVGPPVEYTAPEQLTGSQADSRSEVYALGMVLYQAVTRRMPFGEPAPEETPLTVALKYLQGPPPPPQQFVPDLPPRLVQVIMKALEKDPAHRFQSAQEMEGALSEVRSQLPEM